MAGKSGSETFRDLDSSSQNLASSGQSADKCALWAARLTPWTCGRCSPRTCADGATTRGLSQDDLAYEAGVSRSYLSQLEKGRFYASLKVIGRLAEALEVEPAELLRMPGSTE